MSTYKDTPKRRRFNYEIVVEMFLTFTATSSNRLQELEHVLRKNPAFCFGCAVLLFSEMWRLVLA